MECFKCNKEARHYIWLGGNRYCKECYKQEYEKIQNVSANPVIDTLLKVIGSLVKKCNELERDKDLLEMKIKEMTQKKEISDIQTTAVQDVLKLVLGDLYSKIMKNV